MRNKGLSLKQGTGNRGMGTGNGNGEWGMGMGTGNGNGEWERGMGMGTEVGMALFQRYIPHMHISAHRNGLLYYC